MWPSPPDVGSIAGGRHNPNSRSGWPAQDETPYLRVLIRPIPAPVWKRLVDAAADDEGTISYSDHAAEFINAAVAAIGDNTTAPAPLDEGDADEIATTYPVQVITRILSHIVKVNTVGWSDPKG